MKLKRQGSQPLGRGKTTIYGRGPKEFRSVGALRANVFRFAFLVAVPNCVFAGLVKYFNVDENNDHDAALMKAHAFGPFTFLVALFLAFRASQAYSRFWDGTTTAFQMEADFYDVVSSLMSFCRCSTCAVETIQTFQNTLVRFFSLLNVLVIADLEDKDTSAIGLHKQRDSGAYSYDLFDVQSIDKDILFRLRGCKHKVDLVFYWIQCLIVDAFNNGVMSVPAPILTRTFQELNAGITCYHQALKLSEVPFPFPYTVATEGILIVHWLMTPLAASSWSADVWMVAGLAFVQVFMIWSLHSIALELENPFGTDQNDLNMQDMHNAFNSKLLMLIQETSYPVPSLRPGGLDTSNTPSVFNSNLGQAFDMAASRSPDAPSPAAKVPVDSSEVVLVTDGSTQQEDVEVPKCNLDETEVVTEQVRQPPCSPMSDRPSPFNKIERVRSRLSQWETDCVEAQAGDIRHDETHSPSQAGAGEPLAQTPTRAPEGQNNHMRM